MNLLTIVSFIIAFAVFGFSVLHAGIDTKNLLDYHGITIVLGGTVACTAISYQIDRIFSLFKVFLDRMVRGAKVNYIGTIQELMDLAEINRTEPQKLPEAVANIKDFFMKEAMEMLLENAYEIDHLRELLSTRLMTMHMRHSADAKVFQSMGKFPPAMGLMGAVLGMISLLAAIGKPGAEKTIGPSMSVALIATFYGIALANMVIIPIGENLLEGAKETKVKNQIIVEGVVLIFKKTNPIMLAEELNSYLLPNERIQLRKLKKAA